MTVVSKLGFGLILLFCAAVSLAQGAPGQIDAALLDLSARLGYSVGIGNLSNWRWEQTNFPNDALGCPSAPGAGSGAILGYKFQLTHNAVTYDYRVSNDSALVVYCGLVDAASAAAAAEPESQYSNRLCGETATGGPYMRSRINAGITVEILGSYLNLRGQPSIKAAALLQIPAGWTVDITAGPECVDGYVWWLALVNGQTGYIAEAGDGSYHVAPESPPPLPSREVLNASLVPFLREFGRVSGNFQPIHDWSSDSRFLITAGAPGSDGVWVYDLRHPVLAPQIVELEEGISALAFRPNHNQFALGSDTGVLRLWQIHAGDPLTFSERLFLNAHAGPVSALAFSPDGNSLVSAGREAYTHVDVDRNWAAIVWDLEAVAQQAILSGHTGLINTIAFYPPTEIITGADDGLIRNWEASSGFSSRSRDFGASVIALDKNGDLLSAVALARRTDNLIITGPAGFDTLASYTLPTAGVTSLDFSPDGSMLAVGAAEGVFSIWNTRTHQLIATRETDGAIHDISFSPDGAMIAASTDKYELILYGVPLGSG
ncbi:MAG: hypothetical protein OXI30_16750 [Chloroflexota bacterium]|nr:hypothetical protein [Chloroflexota bacterium]